MIDISAKTVVIFLIITGLFLLFWWIKILLLATIIAYSLASGFNFTAHKVVHFTSLSLKLCRGIVFLVTSFFLFAVCYFLANPVISESTSFIKNFPHLFENFLALLAKLGLNLNNSSLEKAVTKVVEQVFSSAGVLTLGILEIFVFAFIVLFLSYYFLINHEELLETALKFFPAHKHRLKLIENRVYHRLGLWVAVQFLLSIIVGLVTFLGLSYFHIEFAITLSVITAILNLIPILGAAIASFPAIVIASLHDPILGLWVFLFYNVVQLVKDNYVSLKLVSFVGYNPMLLLLAFIIAVNLFDFTGALISVPLLVATGVVFEEIQRFWRENEK